MATLTYDSTPADQPEFNEAEQEALAIGEQAAADQQQMLAGKFKDAEALEQAYIELQKKLGETNGDEEGLQEQAETEEEVLDEADPSVTLINDASSEWAETGELSAETLEQFQAMSSTDLVNAYIQMQGDLPTPNNTQDLSDGDINVIKNSVGGDEAYTNLMNWSGENLDQADLEAFNSLVDSGNARMINLAVAGLKSMYDNNYGYEGEMLTGRTAAQPQDVFRSQAEVVEAMSDPRYDRDPAYRNDVFEKLSRSDINY